MVISWEAILKRISSSLILSILFFVRLLHSQTDSLQIFWDPNPETDIENYQLYRSMNSNSYQLWNTIQHPISHIIDRINVSPGNLYSYRLVAVNSNGMRSDFSDTVSVGIPQIRWAITEMVNNDSLVVQLSDFIYDPDDHISTLKILIFSESHLTIKKNANDIVIKPDPLTFYGEGQFSMIVHDQDSLWDLKNIALNIINNIHHPPQITSTPITTIEAGEFYQYQLIANDPDEGDSLLFVQEESPGFLQIDETTGLITGKTTLSDTGSYQIKVIVTDKWGSDAIQDYTLTVLPKILNHPPLITSAPVTTVGAGEFYRYQLIANDPDEGDSLLFMLEESPGFLQIDETTGLITGGTTLSDTGSYKVIVVVKDKSENNVIQDYILNVFTQNQPPLFINLPDALIFNEDQSICLHMNEFLFDSVNIRTDLDWNFFPGSNVKCQYDQDKSELLVYADTNWYGESYLNIRIESQNNVMEEKSITVYVNPRVDLIDLNITATESRLIHIAVETDLPAQLDMQYWLEEMYMYSYRSKPYTYKHEFVLSHLLQDTTYFYTLTLRDTSGFQLSAQRDSFRTSFGNNQLMAKEDIIVFPNPFKVSQGHENIIFANFPQEAAQLLVYTPAGELVYHQWFQDMPPPRVIWGVVNDHNQQLASGLYIYLISAENGRKIKSGKFAVIR